MINRPNRKVSVCALTVLHVGCLRHCSNYLAGSFENRLLPQDGATPPSVLQSQICSQTFLQRGKNLAQAEFRYGEPLNDLCMSIKTSAIS